MASNNVINISQCDNQLILVAYAGDCGYVVGQVSMGGGGTKAVSISIQEGSYESPALITADGSYTVNLPKGDYRLQSVGFNWIQTVSNPWGFAYTFNDTSHGKSDSASNPAEGFVYSSKDTQFSV